MGSRSEMRRNRAFFGNGLDAAGKIRVDGIGWPPRGAEDAKVDGSGCCSPIEQVYWLV
jgi:hypothetical protein